jgi:hypothetical protein
MAKFRKIGIEFRQNFVVRLISNIKFNDHLSEETLRFSNI